MKAILTTLFIFAINLSFAQTVVSYVYLDANANKFELTNGTLIYTPSGTTGIYVGTTTKTVMLTKIEEADLKNLFTAAIASTADQSATNLTGGGTVKYKSLKKYTTLYIKNNTESKTKLETSIAALIAK